MEKLNHYEQSKILEIGPEMLPVHELFQNEILNKINKGASYIAVDYDKDNLLANRNQIKGEMAAVNLDNLPFKSASIDQIWLMNVFGNYQLIPKKVGNKKIYSLSVAPAFQEFSRITKTGGKVYIGELWPPAKSVNWLKEADFSEFQFKKILYEQGHGLEEFVKRTSKNESVQGVLLGEIENAYNYKPFFIELTKTIAASKEG